MSWEKLNNYGKITKFTNLHVGASLTRLPSTPTPQDPLQGLRRAEKRRNPWRGSWGVGVEGEATLYITWGRGLAPTGTGGEGLAPSPPRLPNFHQNCELKTPIRITRGFPELCSPPATPQGELRVVLQYPNPFFFPN